MPDNRGPATTDHADATHESPPRTSRISITMVTLSVIAILGLVGYGLLNPPTPTDPTAGDYETATPRPGGTDLSASDFGDWGPDKHHSATRSSGRDHTDCSPVETDDALTKLQCKSAIEVRYTAENGDLALDLTVLNMGNKNTAVQASAQIQHTDFALNKPHNSDDDSYTHWEIGDAGKYVIAVRGTTTTDGTMAQTVQEYVEKFFTDQSTALS